MYSFGIYLLCLMFFFMISLVFASSFFFFSTLCIRNICLFLFFPQAASVCTILMVMVLVETAATSNTIRSLKPKKKSASAPTETVPLQLDNRSLVLNNTIRSLENCSISPWSYKYESTLWLRLRTMLTEVRSFEYKIHGLIGHLSFPSHLYLVSPKMTVCSPS